MKLFVRQVLLVVALAMFASPQESREWSFKDELEKLGLVENLTSHGPMQIETLRRRDCSVYNVHVSRWVPHSTRYPAGIACMCDWVMSGPAFYGTTMHPKYIFVTTRALYQFETILDSMEHPFVLISTINDETIPVNTEQRIGLPQGFTGDEHTGLWPRIANHPKVLHWFVENRTARHPKVSTMPIGLVAEFQRKGIPHPDTVFDQMRAAGDLSPKWEDRKTLILSNDRVRDGMGQWRDRRDMHILCEAHPLCTVTWKFAPNQIRQFEPNENSFNADVGNAKFLLMVHGGGLDPCPKLYHSILLGTIPIIESNTLDDAYEDLPVVIVPSLKEFLNVNQTEKTQSLLDQWSKKYAPYYEKHSALRNQTLHMLSEEYWWGKVVARGPR